VHASTFNNECSPVVQYVLFVIKADALGSGRIVALTLTSLLAAGYAVVTFHELRVFYRSKQSKPPNQHRKSSSNTAEEKGLNHSSRTSTISPGTVPPPVSQIEYHTSPVLTVPASNPNIEESTRSSINPTDPRDRYAKKLGPPKARRPRRKQWFGNWDPMLLGIAAFQLVVFAYFVVSTELLLWWNPHQNDGKVWGFGQVCSSLYAISYSNHSKHYSVYPDFGLDRHHSVRFGCIQRIFGAWLQAAAQEERR
jgi:hypothetical protein